jgi:putative solute:sodium symporter small subunit
LWWAFRPRSELQLLWLAVQFLGGSTGRPGGYVAIIGFYAWYMNKLDIEHGVAEAEE